MLSVKKIQDVLVYHLLEKGWKYFAFNTFAISVLRLCKYEADMLSISSSMSCAEFEIKRSRQDYFKDFEKINKHTFLKSGKLICNYFYFVCEENLIFPSEIPSYAGLMYIVTLEDKKGNKKYIINKIKTAPKLHSRKVTDKQLIKILTSVMYKYFVYLKQ